MSDLKLSWDQIQTVIDSDVITSYALQDKISEIIPGRIYLGTWEGGSDIVSLQTRGVKAVLCLNWELKPSALQMQKYTAAGIAFMYIPVDDNRNSSLKPYFETGYRFIQKHLQMVQFTSIAPMVCVEVPV